ncbi:exodeoxyribonuclease V subunit beta [Pasteurella bettyae]|uniref:RecBCD enzyme subunit RecB n=1 Tax=Pasteurella bettyae CCUG 2042 TaxID=1095749 RepID=I3DIB1_9PAST|nr:exodeoxyribonuclease V subunit beta [Pasteurella bettyae]EIJ71454.1 exodeoxyribonuclease V, beta subunit [Pasteurella bettyae CCUG 2042]
MTKEFFPLNPISTPLNSIVLIEASAGTGKTFTMVSLYLRLLLQIGENCFNKPLSVEEILVVTFTEAATQELRERIRNRIHLAKQQFEQYSENQDKAIFIKTDNEFIVDVVEQLDLKATIQRLKIAEQNMDLAAIYTIHGFCRRMLMQYAFNSGIHFNLELVTDESALLTRLTNELWREHFYPLSFEATNYIYHHLGTPAELLKKIQKFVTNDEIGIDIVDPKLLALNFEDFIHQYIEKDIHELNALKATWLAHEEEIIRLIDEAKDKKLIKGASFKSNHLPGRFQAIREWANNPTDLSIPEALSKYFNQSAMDSYLTKDQPVSHAVFESADKVVIKYQNHPLYVQVFYYHYIQWIKTQLKDYKLNHQEKSFDDLLRLLKEALTSTHGEKLAQLIRQQYPFAMIDEFQDTDSQQYKIFSTIYIAPQNANTGFVMIGDPKQAIYQFRGADIFTYLKAAEQAKQRFTLNKNYRSEENLLHSVNQIFDFTNTQPFLYQNIDFLAVGAGKPQGRFEVNGNTEAPLGFYLGDNPSNEQLAEVCAKTISQWLMGALQNKTGFRTDKGLEALRPKDIAVLVRNGYEAGLVKNALQAFNISSVYLSDRSNVFDCDEAKELLLILEACLNPFSERNVLNAIATSVFCLTSAEIQHLKQNENDWEQWINRFLNYQRTWRHQGVLAMLHQLFLAEQIPQKLINMANGERRVTDLLHLAELLQEATALNESDSALLRWFERQIRGENRQDEQALRLESEQDLVKIVTIHKSKGLEYSIVWLPFIGAKAKGNNSTIATYYNEEKQSVLWDMEKQHNDAVIKESYAEEMRLLYVALTRAKYHLSIGLANEFSAQWNALLYALSEGEIGLDAPKQKYCTTDLLDHLVEKVNQENIARYNIDEVQGEMYSPEKPAKQYQAKISHGNIERDWGVNSFSSLKRMNDLSHAKNKPTELLTLESAVGFSEILDSAKDVDSELSMDFIENNVELNDNVTDYPVGYSPFDFPRGMAVGTALHYFFEKQDFSKPLDDVLIDRLLEIVQLEKSWKEPLIQWMNQLLTTPLLQANSFSLSNLNLKDCVKEMQFYLKIENTLDVKAFNQIIAQYHSIQSEYYEFEQIKGMLKGFIDLAFRHNGQYYVLDYKSNFLGNHLNCYAKEHLSHAIKQEHYDLQYLLYSVAMHRYLKQRLPNYNYDRDFGGILYCFVRGMNGKNANYGVYFDKPQRALIECLDKLF